MGDGESLKQGEKRKSRDEEALFRWQCEGDRIGRKQNLSWNTLPLQNSKPPWFNIRRKTSWFNIRRKTSSGRSSNLVFLSLPFGHSSSVALTLVIDTTTTINHSEVNVQVNYQVFLCL